MSAENFDSAAIIERCVAQMSAGIDGTYDRTTLCDEAIDRRRVDKLATEVGEVLDAYNGWVGENPRKGVVNTQRDFLDELLDVAACALCAYEHFTLDGSALVDLARLMERKHRRLMAALTEVHDA